MIRVLSILSVFILTLGNLALAATPEERAEKIGEIRAELNRVSQEMEKAREAMSAQNRTYVQKQRELAYNDPEISRIREEVKELERELIQKRKRLRNRMAVVEGMRTLEKERVTHFRRLQKLKDEEDILRRELDLYMGE